MGRRKGIKIKNEIIKISIHNEIIEGSLPYTQLELKLFFAIAYKLQKIFNTDNFVYSKDLKCEPIVFNASEIGDLIGISKNSFHVFSRCLESLFKSVVKIKHPEDENGWIMMHFLRLAEYKNGKIIIAPEELMIPLYIKLTQHFTIVELGVINKFKSVYSIKIYNLIQQYKTFKNERTFNLLELREILGLVDNYQAIKDFRLNVLDVAKREINRYLEGINFNYELIREGRVYNSIKFTFDFTSIISLNESYEPEYHLPALSCYVSKKRLCTKLLADSEMCVYCFENVKHKL